MPIEILMPKLGLTMTEGLILEWKANQGDQVKAGDVLFVLETEKVTFEVQADENGVLAKVLVQVGETVPVGAVVAFMLRKLEKPPTRFPTKGFPLRPGGPKELPLHLLRQDPPSSRATELG